MKKKFDGKLSVKIYTLDSEEAKPFAHEFRGSTNVRLDKERVPLNIAIQADKMEKFLSIRL